MSYVSFFGTQSTELAKGYNNATLMHQQQSSQGPRTPAKDDPQGDAQMKKKRRSSAYAHSGPGPKVMEEIRKMQTDVGDGSTLFDKKIENPLLRSMEMETPRDSSPVVSAEHDTYDSRSKRCSIARTYRICEPCRPTRAPGVGHGRSEMSVGMEATGVELLTLPGGDVFVRLESQVLTDSERMEAVKGRMSVECPAFHETARDFTRAFVSGSGDMLFLSPEIGMHKPMTLPCGIAATGDVNQDVTDQAVAEFSQFLSTSLRAIRDQADQAEHAAKLERMSTSGDSFELLTQRIVANLTVTPGMQCLLDNGLSPAIFRKTQAIFQLLVMYGPLLRDCL